LQKKFKFVCRPIHPPLGHIASILSPVGGGGVLVVACGGWVVVVVVV
jgi:hypothetical protein